MITRALILLAVIVGVAMPQMVQAQQLTASWYSVASLKKEGTYKHSKGIMANGRRFTNEGYTCASWDYKLGTYLRIRNNENGKSVIVRVTDRTSRRFKGKRVDLSRNSFIRIANIKQGIVPVEVSIL